jgi:uncharacterized protein YutE (UPF0331/DUF86 family)
MKPEFSGIERRLDELNERLQRLEPLKSRNLDDFLADAYLRDIVERNLEVSAQCCIDIANRIISLENAQKPQDYYEAILRLGEIRVMPVKFAQQLAPIAGFRNVLAHRYLFIDWNEVYNNLQQTDLLKKFAFFIQQWMQTRTAENEALDDEAP